MKKSILYSLFFAFILANFLFAQRDKVEVDPLFASAFKKYEDKDYAGSYMDYSAYLLKKPSDGSAMYNRGLCAYELKDYKDGIINFSKSISFGRRKADVFYSRGLCNYIYTISAIIYHILESSYLTFYYF